MLERSVTTSSPIEVLAAKEVAQQLGIGYRKALELMASGAIKSTPGKPYRTTRDAVRAYLNGESGRKN